MKYKDDRIKMMNEILNGIKVSGAKLSHWITMVWYLVTIV